MVSLFAVERQLTLLSDKDDVIERLPVLMPLAVDVRVYRIPSGGHREFAHPCPHRELAFVTKKGEVHRGLSTGLSVGFAGVDGKRLRDNIGLGAIADTCDAPSAGSECVDQRPMTKNQYVSHREVIDGLG
jgi:hypothetical protein